jgi:hypothetical protein
MKSGLGNLLVDKIPLTPKGGGVRILASAFQNLLINCINGFRVISVVIPGATPGTAKLADIKSTANGTIITLPSGMIGSSSTSAGSASQFKIVSDGGDYWNCKTWDGTTLGASVVKVAKPFKLRAGTGKIASEVIRSVTYTYTYSAVTVGGVTGYYTRAVSGSDGSSETDYMIPDPIANDIIYASAFSTTTPSTLADVVWIDLNVDGRAWAA